MVHELHIWHSDCSAKCADAVNYTIWWYMVYGIIMLRIEIKADEEMKILPPHYYCKHVALCTTRLRLTSELMASTVQHSKAPVAQLGSMLANSPVTAVGLAFIASSYILSHSNRPSTSVREGKTRSKGRQLVDFFQRNESLLFFLAAFLLHNTILHFRLNAGLDGISSTLVDDLSWQYSLPVSLVASIISSKTSTDLLGLTQLVPMFIAFIMGSLGSVLGGLTFGCIIRCFTSSQQAVNAGVASSLIASYIGGTVNFYETASVLMHSLPKHLFQKSIRITSAIDVLVMIVYFAFLQRKHKSLLGKGVESGAHTDRHDKQLVDVARHSENNLPIWQLPVLLFCIAIVKASQLLTAKFIPLVGQVPGLSTMLLCALSSAAALLFNNNLTTSIHSNIIQSGQGKP